MIFEESFREHANTILYHFLLFLPNFWNAYVSTLSKSVVITAEMDCLSELFTDDTPRRFSDRLCDALRRLLLGKPYPIFASHRRPWFPKMEAEASREAFSSLVESGLALLRGKRVKTPTNPESYHNQSHPTNLENLENSPRTTAHLAERSTHNLTRLLRIFRTKRVPYVTLVTQIRNRFVQVSFIYPLLLLLSLFPLKTNKAYANAALLFLFPFNVSNRRPLSQSFSIFAFNNHSFVRFLHPSSQK